MKPCHICKKVKDTNAFPFKQYRKSRGFLKTCTDCYTMLKTSEVEGSRWCPSCTKIKPPEEFHLTGARSEGRRRRCKDCIKQYLSTPEGRRSRQRIKRKHDTGFTQTHWDAALAIQRQRCAICELPFSSQRPPCGDHCHSMQQPRGILCNHCNAGLGMFRDKPECLRRAASYLEHPPLSGFNEWKDLL